LFYTGEVGDEGSFADFRRKLPVDYVEEQTARKSQAVKYTVQKYAGDE